MQDKTFLRTIEVAQMFGVHKITIRRWVREGHLPATRNAYNFLEFDPARIAVALAEYKRRLPIRKCARQLGISYNKLYNMIATGQVSAKPVWYGSERRFNLDELKAEFSVK